MTWNITLHKTNVTFSSHFWLAHLLKIIKTSDCQGEYPHTEYTIGYIYAKAWKSGAESAQFALSRKVWQTRLKGKLKQCKVGTPLKRITVDVAGPFLITSNNKYTLVAVNYVSNWPEAYAIQIQEASTKTKVLVDNLVYKFKVHAYI